MVTSEERKVGRDKIRVRKEVIMGLYEIICVKFLKIVEYSLKKFSFNFF